MRLRNEDSRWSDLLVAAASSIVAFKEDYSYLSPQMDSRGGTGHESRRRRSMITLQNAPRNQRGLRVVSVILLVLGGVFIFIGSHNFAVRAIGLGFVLACTYLIRISKDRSRAGLAAASGEVNKPNMTGVPGRLLWIVSVSLVPALVCAWYLLQLDAANGGKEAWPVDVFAGVGLVCAAVWSLLMVKVFGGRGRGK
jgi:hypothetical protein